MSKEKYLITRLSNRKPILLEKTTIKQKEDGVFFNYHETMISQIIESRENKEFEFVCSQIQNFIEENNIDTCFVMNKDELVDCLQEHQKLKIQITDLQSQLAEKEKEETKRMEDFEKRCQEYYKSNQTAIRELEKVKGFLLEKIAEKQSCFDSGNYNDFADGVKTICEIMLISIDKQINELKEMK